MKARIRFLAAWAICLWGLFASIAHAQSPNISEEKFASLKLLSGGIDTHTTQQPPPLLLGLDVTLTKGWKLYWRSPGDAGQSLVLDWKNSTNISDVRIEWPAPRRFSEVWGLEVFGYRDRVVLPLLIWRTDPAQESHLELNVAYSVCSDICVPYEEQLVLDLPVHAMGTPEEVERIQEYLTRVPKPNGAHGIMIESAMRQHEANGKGLLHVTASSMTSRFVSPDVFIESEPGFRFPQPKFEFSDSSRKVDFYVPYEITLPDMTLAEKTITLTLVDGRKAVETELVVPTMFDRGEAVATPNHVSLWVMLLIAVLGGFILNGMPCVLPVLSLKYLSVIKHDVSEQGRIRRSFFITSAGIIASFLAMAVIVIVAKQAGMAVGWGFHFQEPSFLIILALVMVLFAGAMWDLMHFSLPSLWTTKLHDASQRSSWIGDFSVGMFATLLATPCSAPFLGTAVGFALARGALEILAIFAALGVGLALPYLLGALFPQIVRWLPRPGKWMQQVKTIMGLFLAITAVWLIWIVGQQVNMTVAGLVLATAVTVLLILWLTRRLTSHVKRRAAWLVVMISIIVAAILPHSQPSAPQEAPPPEMTETMWQHFEPERIPDLVKAGKVVLVDVTADWCLTCTANELFVLRKPEIVTALSAPNVVAMRADWTRRDPGIQSYLASFGRYGVPFTVVYGPGLPGGKPLRELLTVKALRKALKEASTIKGCPPEQVSC